MLNRPSPLRFFSLLSFRAVFGFRFADLNHLKSTSTGKMGGMEGAPVHAEPETVAGNLQRMSTGTMQGFSSDATLAPAYPARQAAPKAAAKKDDIWSDENWGEDF